MRARGSGSWLLLLSLASVSGYGVIQEGPLQGVHSPFQGVGVTPQPSSAFPKPPSAPLAGDPVVSTGTMGSKGQILGSESGANSSCAHPAEIPGNTIVSAAQIPSNATLVVGAAALSDLLENAPKLYMAMAGSGAIQLSRNGEITPVLQDQVWSVLNLVSAPTSKSEILVQLGKIQDPQTATYLVQQLLTYDGGIVSVLPPKREFQTPSPSLAEVAGAMAEGGAAKGVIGGAATSPGETGRTTTNERAETQPSSSAGSHQEGPPGVAREQQPQRHPGFIL